MRCISVFIYQLRWHAMDRWCCLIENL